MGVRVQGIIIDFKKLGNGVLLIRHESQADLKSLAVAYQSGRTDVRYWLAKFKWQSIDVQDRDRIMSELRDFPDLGTAPVTKRKARNQGKQSRSKHPCIAEILLGRSVTCVVVKSRTWEASDISLLDAKKFPPMKLRKAKKLHAKKKAPKKGGRNASPKISRAEQRTSRLIQLVPNNLHRPWGGVGQ